MSLISAHLDATRRTLACVGLIFLASSCGSIAPGIPLPEIVDEINATLQPNVLVLQPGDGLSIKFPDSSDWDQQTVVAPDGRAFFKNIGELEVAGLTLEELEGILKRLLEETIKDTSLLISITEISPREVVFAGAIRQHFLSVLPALHIDFVEALGRLGVPRDTFTQLEHVVLIRWMPEQRRRRHWVIDAREVFWTHPTKLLLQPGDVLWLPRHPFLAVTDWSRQIGRLVPIPRPDPL